MRVDYSNSVAIRVRVLPLYRGGATRMRVWRADDAFKNDPKGLIVSWSEDFNGYENACEAVRVYVQGHLDAGNSTFDCRWLVAGANASEWIAVANRDHS